MDGSVQCRSGYSGVPRRACAGVGNDCRAEVQCGEDGTRGVAPWTG